MERKKERKEIRNKAKKSGKQIKEKNFFFFSFERKKNKKIKEVKKEKEKEKVKKERKVKRKEGRIEIKKNEAILFYVKCT